MTTLEIINALVASGHTVDYYVRPAENGYSNQGYRITRVDSQTFPTSDAQGNNYARALLTPKFGRKAKLTAKEKAQRHKANPMTGVPKLTKKQKDFLKKANKQLAKTKKGEHITAKKARGRKKALGWGATAKSIKNSVRHYSGVAYRAGVMALVDVLESKGVMPKTSSFLRRYANSIFEESLKQAWEKLYAAMNSEITYEEADEEALSGLKTGRDNLA